VSYLVRRVSILATVFGLVRSVVGQDSNAQIEQSRLFQRTVPPTPNVNADGMALPQEEEPQLTDESFGKQQILKTQEKARDFTLGGGASEFYTNNVALTRRNTVSDSFFVGNVGLSWTPRINNQLQLQLGAGASIFRYSDTSALDFQSVGGGIGAVWTPPNAWGIGLTARYDFTELIDRHSNELLQDHEFSIVAQKIVVLGRSHALTFDLVGSAGISDPFVEQRDQIGFAIGYHLQLARNLAADLGYRHSWYFYNDHGRTDLNQVFSLALRYYVTKWAALEALVSGATNNSNHSVFDYDVFSTGGGVGLTIRF
jgi:hypothetical protein